MYFKISRLQVCQHVNVEHVQHFQDLELSTLPMETSLNIKKIRMSWLRQQHKIAVHFCPCPCHYNLCYPSFVLHCTGLQIRSVSPMGVSLKPPQAMMKWHFKSVCLCCVFVMLFHMENVNLDCKRLKPWNHHESLGAICRRHFFWNIRLCTTQLKGVWLESMVPVPMHAAPFCYVLPHIVYLPIRDVTSQVSSFTPFPMIWKMLVSAVSTRYAKNDLRFVMSSHVYLKNIRMLHMSHHVLRDTCVHQGSPQFRSLCHHVPFTFRHPPRSDARLEYACLDYDLWKHSIHQPYGWLMH